MERKISTPLYIVAFILSVAVFSVGVFVGHLIDQSNQGAISQEVEEMSGRLETIQLFMLLDENTSSFCPVYRSQLDSINIDVEKIGHKLSYLEEEKNAYDDKLKKSYFVLEAQSYLLSKKINERCGGNDTLLLYFYSNTNCSDCRKQGSDILTARDDLSGNVTVKIYSFDGDLGSPVADALKTQFKVTVYPSIIVDGKVYSGSMGKAEIGKALTGGR